MQNISNVLYIIITCCGGGEMHKVMFYNKHLVVYMLGCGHWLNVYTPMTGNITVSQYDVMHQESESVTVLVKHDSSN